VRSIREVFEIAADFRNVAGYNQPVRRGFSCGLPVEDAEAAAVSLRETA